MHLSTTHPAWTPEPARPPRAAGCSDPGAVRSHNEDAMHLDDDGQFVMVADGMGGRSGGAVASHMAVDLIRDALEVERDLLARPDDGPRSRVAALLETSIRDAHDAVRRRAGAEADKRGMGTSLDAVVVTPAGAMVAHVGSTRTYWVRGRRVVLLTRDHTMAAQLAAAAAIPMDQLRGSSLRKVLTSAIGCSGALRVDLVHAPLGVGDQLFLCSDGLYEYLTMDDIGRVVSSCTPSDALRDLMEWAKSRGGHDNMTGVIVGIADPTHHG